MNVFLIAALTADGFIGQSSDHLADWTSPEDKKLFVRLTTEAGVVIMGARTFATIGRALPNRRMIVYTTNPDKINDKNIETTDEDPKKLISRLKDEGEKGVAICGGAAIYTLFMNAGVVSDIFLSIVPKFFGNGIALFDKTLDVNLQLKDFSKLNENTLLLHYQKII